MTLLRIIHEDFTLTVESTRFQSMWDKGVANLGKRKLTSTYRWSEGVECVTFNDNPILPEDKGQTAVFFEQIDYSVWVDFTNDKVTDASFDSPRKDVNERFSWKKDKQLLAGFLNYQNEVGRADMPIRYTLDGKQKRFIFSYDVISAKLDYHSDWKKILEDIEAEYRMLSLDYLRRTYHSIKEEKGENYDIIWWNIFESVQSQFMSACHSIIDRPRHRLRSIETYKRADQIRHFTPQLEQEFAEHRHEEAKLYSVEEQQNTYNTPENRFLKHALLTIQKRYSSLATRVLNLDDNLASTRKESIAKTRDELNLLSRHPFFRIVGPYEGLKQESLILQKDVHYSKVYRTFSILQKSFSLNDGLYRMETKDIATLYEIWCFIQVEKIFKEITGITPEQTNRTEMSGLLTYRLNKGEHSKIIFKKDDVTLAELIYNPRHDDKHDDIKGISDMESRTVPQKPDIVLQLTKDDLLQGMKLTYLFDAKYRLEKDGENDVPPDDAINQMHRYRDAIYYNNKRTDEKLKKEVIGGYILFPGHMNELSRFRKSIDEVNIGAFPMRPNDNQHELLSGFIKELINKHAVDIVEQVIPQKGTTLEVKKRVLVGLVKIDNPQYADFLNSTATLYYSGDTFPTTIPLSGIDYFAPYLPGKGIRDLYEVRAIHTATKVKGEIDDKFRITFDLQFSHQIYSDYKIIELTILHTFSDTTLDQLSQ